MKLKNLPPVLLIVVPWLIILPILFSGTFSTIIHPKAEEWYIPSVLFALFPLTLLLNTVWVFVSKCSAEELSRWNLRIKLCLIPVYIFVLIFAIGVPLAIPFLFIFDAVLLLVSSCYGIRAAFRAKKEERIGKTAFLSLLLCHFCFVADVIAAFLLCRKLKNIPIAQNL